MRVQGDILRSGTILFVEILAFLRIFKYNKLNYYLLQEVMTCT